MSESSGPIHVRWLVRLRWAAIAAQIASIVGVKFLLRAPFPLQPLVLVVSALIAANFALARVLRRGEGLSDRAVAMNLLLDSAGLTGLLIWTGGAMNPFTTLYLLQVALAAILVSRRWSLVVTVGAVASFGALLLARPEAVHVWHSAGMFMLHVRGMWLAFALTAGCLWFFVDRVSASLRAREAELSQARLDAARAERMGALGTLAAGTAHELNTPLGTVAILASELSEMLGDAPEAREYADKIRAQVRRCTEILAKMRSHEALDDAPEITALGPWVSDVVEQWKASHREVVVHLRDLDSVGITPLKLRTGALGPALTNMLENAKLATQNPPAAHSELVVELARAGDGFVSITVVDRGGGISPTDLSRVGEPFFTTRPPGEGMGLGLFLVKNAAIQQGGRFEISCAGGQTRATLTLKA